MTNQQNISIEDFEEENYNLELASSWEEEIESSYENVLTDIVFNLPKKGDFSYEIY
jgi:hypothetical protein